MIMMVRRKRMKGRRKRNVMIRTMMMRRGRRK